MQTLDGLVFILNPQTPLYQKKRAIKDGWVLFEQAVDEVAARLDVPASAIAYYSDTMFGLKGAEATAKYDKDLIKKVDKEGIRLFKKNSAWFKEFSPLFAPFQQLLDAVDPFEMHDYFGLNNVTGSQWVGDTYYVAVRKPDYVSNGRLDDEDIMPVSYTTYLKHVAEAIDSANNEDDD